MMRDAWNRLKGTGGAARIALVAGLVLAAPWLAAAEGEDAVEVTSAASYGARKIETGEVAGLFLQVRANVWMAAETREQLDLARAVPRLLSARLEVDGVQVPPCGAGGNLPRIPPDLVLPSAGDGGPISPLFYLPDGSLGSAIELVVGIDDSGGSGPIEPLARATVPIAKALEDGVAAVPAKKVGDRLEERPDDESLSGTRKMKTVRLQLPAGLTRVLSGGTARLYHGEALAEDLSLEHAHDVVAARFQPRAEATGPWQLRFPAIGVSLDLDVTESER